MGTTQGTTQYILVAGTVNDNKLIVLARYNLNGSLDKTFGGVGWVTVPAPQGAGYSMNAIYPSVVVDPSSGDIFVGGGEQGNPGGANPMIARFEPNGTLDYNNVYNNIVGLAWSLAMQQQPDLTYEIVAGIGSAVARFNLDGTQDTTFGTTVNGVPGLAVLPTASPSPYLDSVHIRSDGGIIATGNVEMRWGTYGYFQFLAACAFRRQWEL